MAANLSIVVVEDHDLAREELLLLLQAQGWRADGADCGEELNKLLKINKYQFALLDLNLPYEDGLSIAKRLRTSHPEIWIVMLTARTRVADRKEGYQSGADVFISKPVNPDELIAVIKNFAARMGFNQHTHHTARLEGAKRLLVLSESVSIRLTMSETLLLQNLALMPERKAPSDLLLEAVFRAGESNSKDNLTVLVSRLRSKLQDAMNDKSFSLVSALRGYGYQLDLPLTLA